MRIEWFTICVEARMFGRGQLANISGAGHQAFGVDGFPIDLRVRAVIRVAGTRDEYTVPHTVELRVYAEDSSVLKSETTPVPAMPMSIFPAAPRVPPHWQEGRFMQAEVVLPVSGPCFLTMEMWMDDGTDEARQETFLVSREIAAG